MYLTIGNIAKDVRREASSHATVLIGYLPVAKLDCFAEKSRSAAKYRLFHHCMRNMLTSIAHAGKTGVTMTCADGQKRSIWPIVAAYVADYPEQCLVACCMENRCPMCCVPPEHRGNHSNPHPARNKERVLYLLDKQHSDPDGLSDEERTEIKSLGIRPTYPPFWKDLPQSDVFEWFTPDLLHQLHKGVFKDHLVKWCTALVGEDELDARFRAMSDAPGLRHFSHGISSVSQWTGHEHKEMERVFLGLLMGRVSSEVIRAVRAILDFIYLASLHSHTTRTLSLLSQSLDSFHTYKDVFIQLGARTQDHFNIPKLHAIEHYCAMIWKFGSADGFNTESPERLHIDYAKDAYRASNRKDYTAQMVTWLRRQEAVDRFTKYLEWCNDVPCVGAGEAGDAAEGYCDEDEVCLVQGAATGPRSQTEATSGGEVEVGQSTGRAVVGVPQAASQHAVLGAPSQVIPKLPTKQSNANLRGISATDIMQKHHAPRFLAALTAYMRQQGSAFTPQPFDSFTLYARIATFLPPIPSTGSRRLKNVIRATPPTVSQGRQPAKASQLDFVLVRTGEVNERTAGTPLEGTQSFLHSLSPLTCLASRMLRSACCAYPRDLRSATTFSAPLTSACARIHRMDDALSSC